MKAYVPNYVPPARPFERHVGQRSSDDFAQDLLREFTKRLSKKKFRLGSQRVASNKPMQSNNPSGHR